MQIEMCEDFFYRVENCEADLFQEFNTSRENVIRNNEKLKFYKGEWIKIKVNNYKNHIVKPTETISKIAKIYQLDEDKLKSDNNLKSDKLFIGQILKIYN